MAKDKDYRRLIHTSRWLRLRASVIAEHPLCERCAKEGFVTAASEVHHIRPVEYGLNLREKERLMFDRRNLRALCHACHVKEHIEMGRSGREAAKRRNRAQTEAAIRKFFGESGNSGDFG